MLLSFDCSTACRICSLERNSNPLVNSTLLYAINEIDGIERISSKFYKDVEAIITNAKKMPDVNKLVAFGNTLDVKTKDLDPDDDLVILNEGD